MAKITWNGYVSKTVNKCYTNYKFESDSWGLYVLPYYEIEMTYKDVESTLKISSSPVRNKLVYLSWQRVNGKRVMKFARFAINQKNHEFKEDMLNSCKTEIMSFINKILVIIWMTNI